MEAEPLYEDDAKKKKKKEKEFDEIEIVTDKLKAKKWFDKDIFEDVKAEKKLTEFVNPLKKKEKEKKKHDSDDSYDEDSDEDYEDME